ncbi:hypothetical protein ABT294_18005 [Nonomuraea sp. NPDC000554]
MVGRDAIVRFPRIFVADVTVDFRGFYADGDVVVVLANGNDGGTG